MTFVAHNQASLTLSTDGFDDLLLTGSTTDANGYTFTIEADDSSEGGGTTDFGAPQPIDVAVERWMIDGAVASTQGHDNRTITFRVVVQAASTAALAAGEAALAQRAGQSGLLTYQPPEGSSVPGTAFEVWTWHLENSYTGAGERNLTRVYDLSFTAKPWARSVDRVSVAATSTGSTTTSIDACTSATGWTGYWGDLNSTFYTNGGSLTVTSSGGANHISKAVPDRSTSSHIGLLMTRTGSVTGLGSTPYLRIDSTVAGSFSDAFLVSVDGSAYLTRVASSGSLSWYALPSGVTSFSTLTLLANFDVQPHKTPTLTVNVADVSATSSANPGIGTGKQLVRSLAVGGSVTTTGSIKVASPSATTLGMTVIYTYADNGSGYIPAMRGYKTGGATTTTDLVNTVSGGWDNITTLLGDQYTVPPNILRESTYAVVVRARCATPTRQPISFWSTGVGSVPLSGGPLGVFYATFAAANTWEWHPLGTVTLPAVSVPSDSSAASVFLLAAKDGSNTLATSEVDLDELYLFDTINGDLTMVTPASTQTRVWVDSADYDPTRNRPAIYTGTQDDRSDAGAAYAPWIVSIDEHRLDPNGAAVFTVTDGVAGAAVSANFYHRWHTQAGD